MIDLNKFIEQAHIYSFQENRGQFVFDDFSEKLAELIVRECMDVVAKKCASPTAYIALVEHFGVKE